MVTSRTVPVNFDAVSDNIVLSNRYVEKVKIVHYPIYTSITYIEGVQIVFWNNWEVLISNTLWYAYLLDRSSKLS